VTGDNVASHIGIDGSHGNESIGSDGQPAHAVGRIRSLRAREERRRRRGRACRDPASAEHTWLLPRLRQLECAAELGLGH